jgi:hypothetical protein
MQARPISAKTTATPSTTSSRLLSEYRGRVSLPFLDGIAGIPSLNQQDGIHQRRRHRIVAENVTRQTADDGSQWEATEMNTIDVSKVVVRSGAAN